jgi:hypothetical protein
MKESTESVGPNPSNSDLEFLEEADDDGEIYRHPCSRVTKIALDFKSPILLSV